MTKRKHGGGPRSRRLGIREAVLASACAALTLLSACLEIDDRKPGVLGAGATAGNAGSSSGGSGNNSSAQGGDLGDAGSGDAGGGGMPEPSVIGTLGEPCSLDSAYACAGTNQRVQLICSDGAWTTYGQCDDSERCDTRQSNAGLCVTMVAQCVDIQPGTAVCDGQQRFDCGIDLVTRENPEVCAGACNAGACTPCNQGDITCIGNGVATCNADAVWDVDPCSPETPHCAGGSCVVPPSCEAMGVGCGVNDESCCTSLLVTGGTFHRVNDQNYPATVSDFRLDKFEVTVGRFRAFVEAVVAGWLPEAGTGKHSHLSGGNGLRGGDAEHESGWSMAWNGTLPGSNADWEGQLGCSSIPVWTPTATTNEELPMQCVNWYHAYAFCIWDGGFLPSEAEWNYAAAGGSDQTIYPWGSNEPGPDANLAAYGCYYGSDGQCLGVANVAPVGSIEAGNGKYGQSDLAGNMWEWTFDGSADYEASCDDCAILDTSNGLTVTRGGSFIDAVTQLTSLRRRGFGMMDRDTDLGLRCARAP